jgi:hypothetical protein
MKNFILRDSAIYDYLDRLLGEIIKDNTTSPRLVPM